MCAQWNTNKFDPHLIVNQLEEARVKGSDKPSFDSFAFSNCISVIYSSIEFSENIPELEKLSIISKAIFSISNKSKLSADVIKKKITYLEKTYAQQPVKKYILLTNLSIDYHKSLKRRAISNCTITLSKFPPKKFSRDTIKWSIKQVIHGDEPSKYSSVCISVNARSAQAAVDDALYAMNLLRGIWNLFFTHRMRRRFSTGKNKPTNPILLGPIHTLHNSNGSLVDDTLFWYNPDYIEPIICKNLQKEWEQFRKYEKVTRKQLSKLPQNYRTDVEDSIVRYTEALDSTDFNKAYLTLWGVLEHLTNTSNSPYDKTIKRASFLFSERDWHRQILQHLRQYRNQTIHYGQNSAQIETLLFQLKRYVEVLLYFHIANAFKFGSLGEATEFLDLPYQIQILQDKIQLMENALKFRQPQRP